MRRLTPILIASAALLAPTAASAWFFFIPGSVIDAAADKMQGVEGDHCVSVYAKVGDKINLPGGRAGTVRSLSGASSRCGNSSIPIRARLDLDEWSAVAAGQQQTLCIPHGLRPGDKYTDMALGSVVIRQLSVTATQCTDAKLPVQATVVSAVASTAPAMPPAAQEAPTQLAAAPKTITDRLRELKLLRDENLITQDVYEAKQKEILQSQ